MAKDKLSARLESLVDSDTRFRAMACFQQERIRPTELGKGSLRARAHGSEGQRSEVWIGLQDTRFSCQCDCAAGRKQQICEHIFAAVLLAESMGVEGFRRRALQQAMGDADEPDRGRRGSRGGRTTDSPGGLATRSAWIEVGGLEGELHPLTLSLVHWWQQPDGTLVMRQEGWKDMEAREIDEESSRLFELLMNLPTEAGLRQAYQARREAIRTGEPLTVPALREEEVLRAVVTARRAVRADTDPPEPLRWVGRNYHVVLRVLRVAEGAGWRIAAFLRDGREEVPVEELDAVTAGGTVRRGEELDRIRPAELADLVGRLREIGGPDIAEEDLRAFLVRAWAAPVSPEIELPPGLAPEIVKGKPRAQWVMEGLPKGRLRGRLRFSYGPIPVEAEDERTHLLDEVNWCRTERDEEAEADWRTQVAAALHGFLSPDRTFPHEQLALVVQALAEVKVEVWLQHQRVRTGARLDLKVTSGVDWFDVHGRQDFGEGAELNLPELLRARKRGEALVALSDGSLGIVPDALLARAAALLQMGEVSGDNVRFQRNQALWVDLLTQEDPEDLGLASVHADEAFEQVKQKLQSGKRPVALPAPLGFRGELRPYQQEGLGWLAFLAEIGFGGILADDMGLGKTVQVLAHIWQRRGKVESPSLVVAPRSVVHQWKAEARSFVPELEVRVHVGSDRAATAAELDGADLLVTSYGVLRRDVELLQQYQWDVFVLDEAQAVKNASTVTARAVRLLEAEQRLVVTGTPVENHLGELANHLDFLQPGLFGRSSALRDRLRRGLDVEAGKAVARALQPLLLRRTKAQVARELPARIEQDLVCEMEGKQARLYRELRDHYAQQLLPEVRGAGMGRMHMQVLEALLRLRQTACHPGLVSKDHENVPTAKFDVLLPRIEELIEEGSKALIFSQFTSYLALLRAQLDRREIRYEYLDGSTVDRGARIQNFQDNPEISLFLISLKAGGVGLNLTAAQYVFLLDPWWNPAVEAQAIDRAHRLGQTEQVMAYRLIAQDTIEEKIRELQQRKRALADSVLLGEEGSLRGLKVEDLEVLLGSGSEPKPD